jgi:ferredoxin-type protein NapH
MNRSTFQKIRIVILTLSTILFPVTFYYLSPVIPLHGSATGIVTGSLLVFLFLFTTSLFVGRSFCAWLCPAGGIQDQVGRSRTRPVPVRKITWMKFVVWSIWLVMLFFFFRRADGVQGVRFAYQTEYGLSTTSVQSLIVYSMVVIVFFLLSLIFGRRTGCHTICWISPFMVIGRGIGLATGIPSLRLKADSDNCVVCGRCNTICPMSLDVQELLKKGSITDNNCILCGRCVDTCKRNVLSWTWRETREDR